MNTQLVTLQYNDQISVNFTNDAWFNATDIAKQYDKRPNDWLSLESTKEYIKCLHAALFPDIQLPEKMVIKQNQLLKTKQGATENGGGSWFHPKLAIAFARWLDVKIAIWCDMQIDKLLHPKRNGLLESATISKSQIGEICCRVDEIALASEDSAKVKPAIWSRFKNHFRISGYKELPVDKYQDALTYIEKLRDEYASGKRMILVDASEYERLTALPQQTETYDSLIESEKRYTISEIKSIFNELHYSELAIVPKAKILNLKKALADVF